MNKITQTVIIVIIILAFGSAIAIESGIIGTPNNPDIPNSTESFMDKVKNIFVKKDIGDPIPTNTPVPIYTPSPTSAPVATATPTIAPVIATANPNTWQYWTNYHYYNKEMQGTGFPRHFGPDRYEKAAKQNTEKDAILWTRNDFYLSLKVDPCLAAGCIYYAQKQTGEDFLGKLEGSTDEDKANYAHFLMRNSSEYWQTSVEKFETYLDQNFSFNIVDIKEQKLSLSYMLPNSASFDNKAPKLIWGDPENTNGHWFELVKVQGKDGKGSVILHYRMECGYQFPVDNYSSGNHNPTQPTEPPKPVPTIVPTPVPTENPGKKNPEAGSYPQGHASEGGHDSSNTHYTVDHYQPTEPPVSNPIIANPAPAPIAPAASAAPVAPAPQAVIEPAPQPANPNPAPVKEPDGSTTFVSPTVPEVEQHQSIAATAGGQIIVINEETVVDGEIAIID